MDKLIATSGAALLLLASTPVFSGTLAEIQTSTPVVATGSAMGGEENTDALKAELDSVRAKLSNTETGRQYLTTRLGEVLAESKAQQEAITAMQMENKDLRKSLRFMTDNRDYLIDEMSMKSEELNNSSAELESKNAALSQEVDRAKKGRSFLSENYNKNRKKLMQAKADNAQLQATLEKTRKGRKFVSAQYLKNLSELKQLKADNAEQTGTLQSENEQLSIALERALSGRNFLSGQLKQKESDLMAALEMPESTEWADNLSATLTESFGSQSSTEVTALSNNSVAIKVGNTGLFRPGSTSLSNSGKVLLNEIGQALISQSDAHIKVVGHTDNIPTGSGSRYANNTELSLARATSALSYLANAGVPAERIAAAGVGEAYPITSNDTEEGQLANRRVEIILTPIQ